MNRIPMALLILASISLAACASSTSTMKRDTADFFTKLSQGYRIHARTIPPQDVMWLPAAPEDAVNDFEDLSRVRWARNVALLAGGIMKAKGVMDGPLFLLLPIDDGEIKGQIQLCQPVENLIPESGAIRKMSRPACRIVETTHRGDRIKLGTAFRALQDFAVEEGLEPTGMGSIRVVRGAVDEKDPANFVTKVLLYVK